MSNDRPVSVEFGQTLADVLTPEKLQELAKLGPDKGETSEPRDYAAVLQDIDDITFLRHMARVSTCSKESCQRFEDIADRIERDARTIQDLTAERDAYKRQSEAKY